MYWPHGDSIIRSKKKIVSHSCGIVQLKSGQGEGELTTGKLLVAPGCCLEALILTEASNPEQTEGLELRVAYIVTNVYCKRKQLPPGARGRSPYNGDLLVQGCNWDHLALCHENAPLRGF